MKKPKGRPAKYSRELIQRIYELYDTTDMGYDLIARELHVSKSMVAYYIRKRRNIQRAS